MVFPSFQAGEEGLFLPSRPWERFSKLEGSRFDSLRDPIEKVP